MKFLSTLFLFLSLLVFGYAAYRWFSTEKIVRGEKAAQKELASTPVDLSTAGGWEQTQFQPARGGAQAVILETKSGSVPTAAPLSFHGAVEVEVDAPDGRAAFRSGAGPISHTLAEGLTWTLLGDFSAVSDSRNWIMRVRVAKGDPAFAGTVSRVYVRTPPKFDAKWFETRQRLAVALVATSAVVLLLISGFFYLAARRRRMT